MPLKLCSAQPDNASNKPSQAGSAGHIPAHLSRCFMMLGICPETTEWATDLLLHVTFRHGFGAAIGGPGPGSQ